MSITVKQYTHSVTLDASLCKGCITCIKRCPTEAIRVRDKKAFILSERCIDCGECIKVCPHRAKKAICKEFADYTGFKHLVALPAPSLYAQFNNVSEIEQVLSGLKGLGFDSFFEVGKAAEIVSDATRKLLEKMPKPVLSSACPAIVRLVTVRFPHLIDHVLPLVSPMELAARLAKFEISAKTGLSEEEIGCIFITPCPAKITALNTPIGSKKSAVDGAVTIKDIYPLLVKSMQEAKEQEQGECGRIGVSWASSGGESAGLVSVENYLACDGIENVIKVLEDLEDDKFEHIDFVELNACNGGCVGGVLTVENPYIAKTKLKRLRKYLPVSKNHLENGIPSNMLWDTHLEYSPALEIHGHQKSKFEAYAELEEILKNLPMLDCGSCGSPTCRCFAQDVVSGAVTVDKCVVKMQEKMQQIISTLIQP